jgi:hypothetical protein
LLLFSSSLRVRIKFWKKNKIQQKGTSYISQAYQADVAIFGGIGNQINQLGESEVCSKSAESLDGGKHNLGVKFQWHEKKNKIEVHTQYLAIAWPIFSDINDSKFIVISLC